MDNDTNTTIGKVVAVTFGRAVVVGAVVNADLVLVDAVELVTEGVVVLGAFVVGAVLAVDDVGGGDDDTTLLPGVNRFTMGTPVRRLVN